MSDMKISDNEFVGDDTLNDGYWQDRVMSENRMEIVVESMSFR